MEISLEDLYIDYWFVKGDNGHPYRVAGLEMKKILRSPLGTNWRNIVARCKFLGIVYLLLGVDRCIDRYLGRLMIDISVAMSIGSRPSVD